MDLAPIHLLPAWGIGEPTAVTLASSGTMNETWLVTHSRGRAVLRRHRHTDASLVALEHQVLDHVRTGSVPCPEVFPTLAGATFVKAEGQLHSLYSRAPGHQVPRGSIGRAQAREMGRMLARVHLALADFDAGGAELETPVDVDATLRHIDFLLELADSRSGLAWVRENLLARRTWLEHNQDPPPQPVGPSQLIHGDFQDTNLFFQGDRVSSVIDWDRARRSYPACEVVRALNHGLDVEPGACRALLDGYRGERRMHADELVEAAEWFQFQQANSLWLFDQLLVEDNARVKQLGVERSFVPFLTRWAEARLA